MFIDLLTRAQQLCKVQSTVASRVLFVNAWNPFQLISVSHGFVFQISLKMLGLRGIDVHNAMCLLNWAIAVLGARRTILVLGIGC